MHNNLGLTECQKSLPPDQEEEAGAGQPEVSPAVTINVEVFCGQMTVWIQYLQSALNKKQSWINARKECGTNCLLHISCYPPFLPAWWSNPEREQRWWPAHALCWTCFPGDLMNAMQKMSFNEFINTYTPCDVEGKKDIWNRPMKSQ